MYLTGIADEASQKIEEQIKATKELGWNAIESRFVNGKNIHDISEEEFDEVARLLMAPEFILMLLAQLSETGERMFVMIFQSRRQRFPGDSKDESFGCQIRPHYELQSA